MEESKNLREAVVIDAVDRQIIEQLQLNGRMTNAELAERVGIAPSTCVARVRSLVSRGIITGFTASVDPAVMGMTLQVLVSVTIRSGARQRISEFSEELRALPEDKMLPPTFGGQARRILLQPATEPTPGSAGSNGS